MKPNLILVTSTVTMGVCMTLVLMFPGISFALWRIPAKWWEKCKAKILKGKSRDSRERLRHYWEIDLTK